MYDYLFAFPTESDAQAALAPFGLHQQPIEYEGVAYGGGWDASRVMAPISITMLDGSRPSGWWLGVTLNERDLAVDELAQAILDPSLPEGLKPSDYVVESKWPTENVNAIAEISPMWAGRSYRFPGLPAPVAEEPSN